MALEGGRVRSLGGVGVPEGGTGTPEDGSGTGAVRERELVALLDLGLGTGTGAGTGVLCNDCSACILSLLNWACRSLRTASGASISALLVGLDEDDWLVVRGGCGAPSLSTLKVSPELGSSYIAALCTG